MLGWSLRSIAVLLFVGGIALGGISRIIRKRVVHDAEVLEELDIRGHHLLEPQALVVVVRRHRQLAVVDQLEVRVLQQTQLRHQVRTQLRVLLEV